ncbi:MAG: endo,4-beta-xylanase [Solirubrobacteraceae bacterium]|jgi:endo-1,4-beta-xylanase|nr:endo,4-beta-xylanase [Solirubrobacteraceae bacterium]
MSGNRQLLFSIFLLMLVPAAAEARDVPLNSLGTSAGQAQRRADATILLRPGATVRTDFAVREGHGVTAQLERRDRCSANLQVTARLGDQAASTPIGRTTRTASFRLTAPAGTTRVSLSLTQLRDKAKNARTKKRRVRAKTRRAPTKARGKGKARGKAKAARRPVRSHRPRRGRPRRKVAVARPCQASVLLRGLTVLERLPVNAAMTAAHFGQDPFYQALFPQHFDGLTPENELKWASTEPQQGQFTFEAGDRVVNWAIANGKSVRGHVLVWDFQNSDYVTNPKDFYLLQHQWKRAELIAVMQEHILNVVAHFRGRIPEWDVVNEAFNDDGSFKNNVWYQVIGPEYIALAFRLAHQADPQAKLFYNDLGYEAGGPHTEAVLNMVRGLREQGVPIDGVGFESHFDISAGPVTDRMRPVMQAFADLGLAEEITELDVNTGPGADKLAAEAELYRQVARACVEQIACKRITTWGYTDRYSWFGSDRQALPFDVNYQPKAAWQALQSEARPGI